MAVYHVAGTGGRCPPGSGVMFDLFFSAFLHRRVSGDYILLGKYHMSHMICDVTYMRCCIRLSTPPHWKRVEPACVAAVRCCSCCLRHRHHNCARQEEGGRAVQRDTVALVSATATHGRMLPLPVPAGLRRGTEPGHMATHACWLIPSCPPPAVSRERQGPSRQRPPPSPG